MSGKGGNGGGGSKVSGGGSKGGSGGSGAKGSGGARPGGTMKAPGGGGRSYVSRAGFESNPQIYFAGLHAGISCDDLSYGVCKDRDNYLKQYVLTNIPSCSNLLTSDNLLDILVLGKTMSQLQIPSFGRKKTAPRPAITPASNSSPASASSSVTLSDTTPSTDPSVTATNPVANTATASPNVTPSVSNPSGSTNASAREKARGKRHQPNSALSIDDVPLSQRVRPSGPNVISLARPPQTRPPTPSRHASASGMAPWNPHFIRTDGSSVKPT
ncbi:uncharacterized protein LOC132296466 [Cornus florida]|uniref:uncharacterized protein LOC132296466 n=1 Tax=Cornus florida TaxID=4283 RepID=UPI0028A20034|nr:uncharacterized protein LOC132296466 [Cornus florida]